MRRKFRHREIISKISEETGIDVRVIHLIVRKFYSGLRSLLSKNEEINIKGFFILKLTTHFKNKVKLNGKEINLRPRKDKKQYYVKKELRK